jgi:hypothetical protein
MGSTRAKWRTNQLAFYDGSTFETVEPFSPNYLFDDFYGTALNGDIWTVVEVLDATYALALSNITLALAATDEAEDAGIYMNTLAYNIDKGPVFEARCDISVLPTGVAEMHIGFQGEAHVADDQVAAANDIDYHIFFVLDGSGAIVIYTDDNSHDNNAVDTGVTAAPGTYNIFKIDCNDPTDVLFYIDGVQVASSTTFDLSNGSMNLMPNFMVTKAGGLNVLGSMKVDYARCWQTSR